MDEEFTAEGRLSELPAIISFVESWCERCGVEPAAWFDLQLAVEEASTNVIEHAYRKHGGKFWVRLQRRGADVVVTLRDRGRRFRPETVSAPDFSVPLEDRPPGGLGLHLMQQLMDEVRFSFSDEAGNTLVMVKKGVAPTGPVAGAPSSGAPLNGAGDG